MDLTGIDQTIANLAARLAEATARHTAGAIFAQIKKVKAKRDDQATINELEEIVRDLINDRSEALQIAQAYEQELVAQRMSDQDIEFIIDSVIPTLEDIINQTGTGEDTEAVARMEAALNALEPLLSTKTLTVLQLLGFNFKKAIGEPLTFLVQKLITTRVPTDPQTALEMNKIHAMANVELLKIAQDEEATARLNRVLANWRGTN